HASRTALFVLATHASSDHRVFQHRTEGSGVDIEICIRDVDALANAKAIAADFVPVRHFEGLVRANAMRQAASSTKGDDCQGGKSADVIRDHWTVRREQHPGTFNVMTYRSRRLVVLKVRHSQPNCVNGHCRKN